MENLTLWKSEVERKHFLNFPNASGEPYELPVLSNTWSDGDVVIRKRNVKFMGGNLFKEKWEGYGWDMVVRKRNVKFMDRNLFNLFKEKWELYESKDEWSHLPNPLTPAPMIQQQPWRHPPLESRFCPRYFIPHSTELVTATLIATHLLFLTLGVSSFLLPHRFLLLDFGFLLPLHSLGLCLSFKISKGSN